MTGIGYRPCFVNKYGLIILCQFESDWRLSLSPLTKRESMVECSRSLDFAGWRRGHLVTLITWRSSVRIRYPLSFPLTIEESVIHCQCSLNGIEALKWSNSLLSYWRGSVTLQSYQFYFWVKSKNMFLAGKYILKYNWNYTLLITFVLL